MRNKRPRGASLHRDAFHINRAGPGLEAFPGSLRRNLTVSLECLCSGKELAMPLANRFRPLPLQSLDHAPSLPTVSRTAEPHHPALSLLTDLQQSPCVIASHQDGGGQTLHLMQRAGVRMVFVSGADGALVGMVTAEDIQGSARWYGRPASMCPCVNSPCRTSWCRWGLGRGGSQPGANRLVGRH